MRNSAAIPLTLFKRNNPSTRKQRDQRLRENYQFAEETDPLAFGTSYGNPELEDNHPLVELETGCATEDTFVVELLLPRGAIHVFEEDDCR